MDKAKQFIIDYLVAHLEYPLEVAKHAVDNGKNIVSAIEAYGKQQYNQAIDDAAEKASTMIETRTDGYDTWDVYTVDKQSILTLKK